MKTLLYVIPGSHPSLTARLMLERKGIPYRRIDLPTTLHKPWLRLRGFPGATVPALILDGRKVQGSRAIARALESYQLEPRLFPRGAAERARVEEAERWGDEVLQPVPRRLAWWVLKRRRAAALSFLEGSRLPLPTVMVKPSLPFIVRIAASYNGSTDEAVMADLAALPEHLARVDAFIAEGALYGPHLNAADYQIGTSLRLLSCFDDLRPFLEGRPGAALGMRVAPEYPGRLPPALPAAWLASLAHRG